MQRKEMWKNSETPNTITDLIHNLERAKNKIPNRKKKKFEIITVTSKEEYERTKAIKKMMEKPVGRLAG